MEREKFPEFSPGALLAKGDCVRPHSYLARKGMRVGYGVRNVEVAAYLCRTLQAEGLWVKAQLGWSQRFGGKELDTKELDTIPTRRPFAIKNRIWQ